LTELVEPKAWLLRHCGIPGCFTGKAMVAGSTKDWL